MQLWLRACMHAPLKHALVLHATCATCPANSLQASSPHAVTWTLLALPPSIDSRPREGLRPCLTLVALPRLHVSSCWIAGWMVSRMS